MNIHKRTRLTLMDRQEIWRLYQTTTVEGSVVGGALPRQPPNDL